jgi:hypothetical protein
MRWFLGAVTDPDTKKMRAARMIGQIWDFAKVEIQYASIDDVSTEFC